MFEFVIIVAIIAIAGWFYLKNNKTQDEFAEANTEIPVDVQNETAAPEPTIVEPVAPVVKRAEQVAVDSVPEDSALKRHYLQNEAAQRDSSAKSSAAVKTPKPMASESGHDASQASALEELTAANVPEDAALKRHHIQRLVAETEAAMPPRPTDSMLRRHYDAQLLSAVMSKLEEVS